MKRAGRTAVAAALVALGAVSTGYVTLLEFPAPLFPYRLQAGAFEAFAREPFPPEAARAFEAANERLAKSELASGAAPVRVFFCGTPACFAFFDPSARNAGAYAHGLLGGNVFLRPVDFPRSALIGPSGNPTPPDRPLGYFLAHEVTHVRLARHLGLWRFLLLPHWVNEGYADVVGREVDLPGALAKLQGRDLSLDPERSGLYLRYQLMVAFELQKKHVPFESLLQSPPPAAQVDRELEALKTWTAPANIELPRPSVFSPPPRRP